MRDIRTAKDAWQHVAKRVAQSVVGTIVLTITLLVARFGPDLSIDVRLETVAKNMLFDGVFIAALLTGLLTYRPTVVMRELHQARAELFKISRTDPLTGILNRRGFDEAATEALAKPGDGLPVVVLMCDIDHFKRINDSFGHQFGDQVLSDIGKAVSAFGEEYGALVCRHGGEEFAILMTGVTGVQAIRRANILRQTCARLTIRNEGGSTPTVTVSIGLAMAHEKTTLADIMRAADKALYLAKNRGRNLVVPAQVDANIAA
jgi:diguanylate cyclase (GGDEF)-like protein